VEACNVKLRDELLDREVFYRLTEVTTLTEQWQRHDSTLRPHPVLAYRPPHTHGG
jgi:putative transposase